MPRRVGLIVCGFLDTVSGGYLYDRKLVARLRARGDEVIVFSPPPRSYPRQLADNLSNDLVSRVEAASLDLLLEDELNHPSLFWLNRRLRHRTRAPIVSIVHHLKSSERRPAARNALLRLIERAYLRSVDAFIFNSHVTARSVHALIGAQRPWTVAYPAGDRFAPNLGRELIKQRSREAPPLRIVFLGNVIPRKELHTLVEAMALLSPEQASLTVIGNLTVDPRYVQTVRRRIEEGGLTQRISFSGALPDCSVAEALRRAHVLVVPSSYEGFGIVYLEGMSFGLPAVGTTAGAAPEVITHGLDGFLVPPGRPDAIARALTRLAEHPATLVAMSRAALCRARSHPTWEQSMSDAARFLDTIASSPQTT